MAPSLSEEKQQVMVMYFIKCVIKPSAPRPPPQHAGKTEERSLLRPLGQTDVGSFIPLQSLGSRRVAR